MKFDDFVCTEAIRSELLAADKQAVIHEMAQALLDAGQMAEKDYQPIVDAILEREARGSTGMGRGGTIPHTTSGRPIGSDYEFSWRRQRPR